MYIINVIADDRWYIPVHFYRQPSQIYIKKKCPIFKNRFFIIWKYFGKWCEAKCLMCKKNSNMTKFYWPNKSIYYFFKINTQISTSFRRSVLISFWIDAPGTDPGGAPLHFFVTLNLIQTNFGFIVCYDIDNVHIEVNIGGGSRISS
jgi:hypothetical protein